MAQNVLGWCRAVQTSLENSMKQLRRIQRHRMIWIYSGYQDIFKELLDTVVAAQCQCQCIGIRYCQIDVFNRAASVACTPQVLKLCWMTMRRHVKTLEMCWYFPNDRKNCRAFQGANGLANHVPWVQPVRWFFLVGFWAQCGAVAQCWRFSVSPSNTFARWHLHEHPTAWKCVAWTKVRLNKGCKMFQIGSMFQSLAQRVDFSNRSIWRW